MFKFKIFFDENWTFFHRSKYLVKQIFDFLWKKIRVKTIFVGIKYSNNNQENNQ